LNIDESGRAWDGERSKPVLINPKDQRREFFSALNISAKPSATEREEAARRFKMWVSGSAEWWGGEWANENDGVVDWHLTQFLRTRSIPKAGEYRFVDCGW
jgi:hypothetical protein